MKYLGHLPIILFLYYVHVHSKKFNCIKVKTLYELDTNFLESLNGKVYWIVKHFGYSQNMRKFMYNRLTYEEGMLTETTYYIDNEKEHILLNSNTTYQVHDDYLAFHAVEMPVGKVKFEQSHPWGFYRLKEPFNRTNGFDKTPKWDIAYVHYNSKYDFNIIQSCNGKYATVEVGDRIYRTMMTSENMQLRIDLDKRISAAIAKLGLESEGPYNDPDKLLNIFPVWW